MSKIILKNLRPQDNDYLFIMLTADTTKPYKGDLTPGECLSMTDFVKKYPDMSFDVDYIAAGRLYVGYDKFPDAPVPNGTQYYGWIEFTRLQTDPCVWINLTNVDMVGLPLAIEGMEVNGTTPWSLGYKSSAVELVDVIKKKALTGSDPSKALITCSTQKSGYTPFKIVAPNISPVSYKSYDQYIASLRAAAAKLVITTDTPEGSKAKIFSGGFVPMPEDVDPAEEPGTNPAISLKSAEGDTFEIQIGQFTTKICYECDGGTLIYNGKTVPQNQIEPRPLPPDAIYANSAFRNIMIGINEGYFSDSMVNYSANFPYLTPFAGEEGSIYAELLHLESNSYGFPYADSNLKVLISSSLTHAVTLTVMTDDKPYGYSAIPPDNGNQPQSGQYQFGIGAGSQALGNIKIGNCTYLPTSAGAYGGFLPTLSEWTQMYFTGPGRYVWFKTTGSGFFAGSDCFNVGGVPFTGTIAFDNFSLQFPANVSWNIARPSPPNPG